MFKSFSAFEYLLIDVANQFGLDKKPFEDRIEWAESNIDKLEQLATDRGYWKEYHLYVKAVMALRDVQEGKPTGHMVGFDAACSGIQMMSVVTRCEAGCEATGLIDPNRRADAYKQCLKLMETELGVSQSVELADIKQAVMTSFYGSVAEPVALFGKDTPELNAFYRAVNKLAPLAIKLMGKLRQSWNAYEQEHTWVLPDLHVAKVPVLQSFKARVEIDELDHRSFTYIFEDNVGTERGVSNIANVVHSIDAYVLRSLIRRCSYNPFSVRNAIDLIDKEVLYRILADNSMPLIADKDTQEILDSYEATKIADIAHIEKIDSNTVTMYTLEHLKALQNTLRFMQKYPPFELITIHDDFKCHANNMDFLRRHYTSILAEISNSSLIDNILTTINKYPTVVEKGRNNIAPVILNSNYAIS